MTHQKVPLNNDDGDDQLFTFRDVPKYAYVVFRGHPGYVTQKGRNVHPYATGLHMKIQYVNGGPGGRNSSKLAKSLVNKYLREKHSLWVDFAEDMHPYSE